MNRDFSLQVLDKRAELRDCIQVVHRHELGILHLALQLSNAIAYQIGQQSRCKK